MSGEIEEYRQELIVDGGTGESEADLQREYAPGSFGCHEALHMTLFLQGAVDSELLCHGAVLANPEWFALAERASTALAQLYQAIGASHLGVRSEHSATS